MKRTAEPGAAMISRVTTRVTALQDTPQVAVCWEFWARLGPFVKYAPSNFGALQGWSVKFWLT